MKKMLTFCLSCLLIFSLQAQSYRDSLHQKLTALAASSPLPGFGVCLVTPDKILFKGGYGFADVKSKTPYSTQTIQNIGSTSKTLIGWTLMKLVEQGKVKLDDPVNSYLPFPVVHPRFPDRAITIRQLATHTSSLTDGKKDMVIEYSYLFEGDINFTKEQLPKGYAPYFRIYRENQPMPMDSFLYHSYHPQGKWYHRKNFLKQAPGTRYAYTNIGAALLAHLIERVAEKPFWQFTQDELMKPLGMTHSAWRPESLNQDQMATRYMSNGLQIPNYRLITYPDGGLYTCVDDFALYLQEMIRGLDEGSKLLGQEYYQEMMSNQLIPEHLTEGEFDKPQGLMWRVNETEDNIAMDGADPGIGSYVLFTTAGNVGMYIVKNASSDWNEKYEQELLKIRGLLFQYAGKLLKE